MKKQVIEQIISAYNVNDSVTVEVSEVSIHDDFRVEIRNAVTGQLIWRAWDFEEGFLFDLKANLQRFSQIS